MKSVISMGYGYCGGGALRDVFREFDCHVRFPGEFRLIKERYGLSDLEHAFFSGFDPDKIDIAIKDFRWLCEKYASRHGRFRKAGLSYNFYTADKFLELIENFIDEITAYQYPMSWHLYDFRKSYPILMRDRLNDLLIGNPQKKYKMANMPITSYEAFICAARNLIDNILNSFLLATDHSQEATVLLSKALSPSNMKEFEEGRKYFKESKVFLIDRDPRDIYMELLLNGKQRYLPSNNDAVEKARSFVNFFKVARTNQKELRLSPNVLFVRFEDLVLDYEKTLNKLYEWLEVSPSGHLKKGKIFDPKISSSNVGQWRKLKGEELLSIKLIESQLDDFLYENL